MSFLSYVDVRKGSTMRIGPGPRRKSLQNIEGTKAHRRMKQALLLDDNIAQLTVRELVLRKAEVECHVATRGQSALALLRSDVGRAKIGVVITDHLMPDMDGVEFVRQLRSFNHEVPIIVISGVAGAAADYAGSN